MCFSETYINETYNTHTPLYRLSTQIWVFAKKKDLICIVNFNFKRWMYTVFIKHKCTCIYVHTHIHEYLYTRLISTKKDKLTELSNKSWNCMGILTRNNQKLKYT